MGLRERHGVLSEVVGDPLVVGPCGRYPACTYMTDTTTIRDFRKPGRRNKYRPAYRYYMTMQATCRNVEPESCDVVIPLQVLPGEGFREPAESAVEIVKVHRCRRRGIRENKVSGM